VATLFLRLGATSFGGPAAHLSLMHQEVVRRRGWLDDAEFADLLAAVNLIPGPNSTEMAIYVGRRVAGWRGLLVAGACFIIPAVVIVSALAVGYERYGRLPDTRAFFSGVIPVVLAIMAQAVWRLSQSLLRAPRSVLLAAISLTLSLLGVHELWLLLGLGIAMIVLADGSLLPVLAAAPAVQATAAAQPVVGAAPLSSLMLFFLKVGSILFGSGYVLIAFLRADLVERWHWLTDQQLLDAVAVGQMTPGPVFTTATFIGYLLAGWQGAAVCTVGIFLPAFVFVAFTDPLISRIRRSTTFRAFLDGAVAASLGLMAAVTVALGASTLRDPMAGLLCAGALALLLGCNLNASWMMAAGGLVCVVRGM
jgi:chromate transporter